MKRIRLRKRFWQVSAVAYLILLTIVSLTPSTPAQMFTWQDKIYHLCLYFGLATVLFFSRWFKHLWQVALLAFSFGFAMELVQQLTPYRSFDWWDAAANGIGVALWLFAIVQMSWSHLSDDEE